jgi:hypothetical protein
MSFDRFVYWTDGAEPRIEDVVRALRVYLRGIGKVRWHGPSGRYYATLPGKPTDPAERKGFSPRKERWIEVFFHADCVDIITREADPITSAIADGFARFCVRRWQGRWEGDRG